MLRAALAAALLALVTAAPAAGDLRVTAPRAGSELQASRHARVHAVRLVVRGRAGKREQVTVTAPCVLRLCTGSAVANGRGRWVAAVDLVLPARVRRLTVRVASTMSGEVVTRALPVLAPPPPAPVAGRRWLVMTGDSLAVGTALALPGQLPELNVTTNAVTGRSLEQGMAVLRDTPLPRRPILAFSLFTNDDARSLPALEAAVRTSVARAGRGCALWATIRRPARGGLSYAPANELLQRLAADPALAGRLQLVDWAAHTRRHPELLRRDGVHATTAGYLARARLYADAARRCAT